MLVLHWQRMLLNSFALSRSPDLLLAPKEKCFQEGFFSLEKIIGDKLIYKIVTLYVTITPLRASSEPFAVAI